MVHDESLTVAERAVPGVEGRAERPAAITGGRLDVDLLERRLIQDAPVRHRVQGDSSGHAQFGETGLPVGLIRQLQDKLFGNVLNARGDVGVVLVVLQ